MGNARLDEFKPMRRKINNGVINKFVQEDELPLWLEQGWNRRWYNQDEQNKKNSEGNKNVGQMYLVNRIIKQQELKFQEL